MNIRPSNLASISAPDDDFVSHCGSWREALTIARVLARVEAPDIDDRTYWDREIRAYDEAFASYTPGAIPEDFRTHHASWREALVIAHDNARVQAPDVDDRGYWAHELRAYDRAFASIGLLPPPLPTAAAQHSASDNQSGIQVFRVYHLTDTRPRREQELSHNEVMLSARRDTAKAAALFSAPTDTCAYRFVAEVKAKDLEDVFETTNTINKPWWTNHGVDRKFVGPGCRSTSVGDIVVDEAGTGHFCAPMGWKEVGPIQHTPQSPDATVAKDGPDAGSAPDLAM
ncbi:hypothetical protein [Burkholderia vietnamiensis]|uniref:hypothetical protein n=1 Tax=Burkholderia vietnamiensis TaxID=60552 RepID=UPI001CF125D3|nr:hypothetical protein [Burkholderia vietnamiensis]MCA8228313.1 hypothetical protein [Burkholderia vietnamiensis]